MQFAICNDSLLLLAQDAPPPANKPTLAGDQDAIRARYRRFSLTLQQMAEVLRKQDPERADLLFRAIGKSQESRVEDQMALIFQLLNREQPQLGEAIERQEELVGQLKALLDLMQSEDRRSEIEKEKQRLQDLLKDINKLIGKEKDVRAGTERGDDTKKLADKQGDVDKQAGDLEKKIDKQDAERNGESSRPSDKSAKSSDKSKGSEQKPDDQNDKPSDDKKDDDGKKQGDKENKPNENPADDDKADENQKPADKTKPGKNSPKDSDSKPGTKTSRPMPSDQNQKSPGKPSDNDQQQQQQKQQNDQQSDSESSPQSPDQKQPKTPGRKELEQSRDAMQRAIGELKKQQRDNASKEQDEAIRKLMEAKDKIEEILRQLREEEQKLLLAALEARFKKMLAMQLMIYHDTVRLAKAGESETSSVQARSVKLAQNEQEILVETDKALVLLKEEGSSVAFPEAVVAIRQDVQSLVKWLRDAQVGELTQAVEKDVIEALEELIDALQKEMEKSDDEKKQQQQQQQNSDQSQPLVDQLAELKMLRSLQFRVNRRTKQLSRQVEGEQATQPEIVEQLLDLSGRQSRIQQATADLVKGKNK